MGIVVSKMRILLFFSVLAIHCSISLAAKLPRDKPEDGICHIVNGPPPTNSTCPHIGVLPSPNAAYFDPQAVVCDTYNQCADKCGAETGICKAFSWNTNTNPPTCTFYGDTLTNQGFTPVGGDPNILYSDISCYTCPCCYGLSHEKLLDKGFFESPTPPNRGPWLTFPPPSGIPNGVNYPNQGGNSLVQPGPQGGNTHHDAFESAPIVSPGPFTFGKYRASFAQKVHLCNKTTGNRYLVDFDYFFDTPVSGSLPAYLKVFLGKFTALPPFVPSYIASIVPGSTNVNQWAHYQTCAITLLPGQNGYIQFDGWSASRPEGFHLDNIDISCAKKTVKSCP